ncbi:hypothetical protein [Streptomyces subrutilus]|uniref:Uncharacterized protein n=1 Tax=Streptomyces subrutilus TaxID=36818 RepID=A0A5P2UZH6_9ACTN|nr:hypothetical protein [Streptomyces subrutilus]QEU82167.1 hypothetical protein CP968_31335 [Streptomyces subrutilus]WSJ28354.1 hypothetical protein OG479_03035 [Streptomyces subrutilus]GGZ92452.1 hypothetical protein GCM10010371_60360 [Streptomyces subrutilus]
MDHDLRTDDRPDRDGARQRERARRTVASHATGPEDFAALLDALDLHAARDAERTARTSAAGDLHTFNNG